MPVLFLPRLFTDHDPTRRQGQKVLKIFAVRVEPGPEVSETVRVRSGWVKRCSYVARLEPTREKPTGPSKSMVLTTLIERCLRHEIDWLLYGHKSANTKVD